MLRIESWQEHKEAACQWKSGGTNSHITAPTAAAALSCQSFISQVCCMLEASLKAAWSFVTVFVAGQMCHALEL